MKISIIEKFAADALNAPAVVTGGGGKCSPKTKKTKSKKTKCKTAKTKKTKSSKSGGGCSPCTPPPCH